MEKPISKACPITHHRWGGNEELPEDDVQFVFEVMPQVQERLDAGLCLLMEIENPEEIKSSEETVEQINMNSAVRTGRMAFVSKPMMIQLFGEQGAETNRGFINKEIMDQLEVMAEKTASNLEEVEEKYTPFQAIEDGEEN